MGKPSENHRNTIGKPHIGKPWENHGKKQKKQYRKTKGKPCENIRNNNGKPNENHKKTKGNHRKTIGNPWEIYRKSIEHQ